jgi:arylsulfatase A-like enzyme
MEGPGVARGRVVRGLASQVDVAPTLLALAGLPPLDAPGREWASAARGGVDETDRDLAFSDTWFKEANRAAVYRSDRACQVDFTPNVRGPGGNDFVTGCFDRRGDPEHAEPLADDDLTDALLHWRRERVVEGLAWGPAGAAVPSAELNAQLEALGYVSGAELESAEGPAGAPPAPARGPR